MAERDTSKAQDKTSRRPPATTPEARENQLVSLAFDLAEKRFREGTASAQETTHFLKLGSSREFLEQERLRYENELTKAKIENLASAAKIEELYKEALSAMTSYQGRAPLEDQDEFED